ncbi:MAG: hypothetical protein KJO82_02620 [Gammaproteobacteria bacterium]|nr:hypothetical protein [Gammaproteobacteria bacterium]NNC76887.1 hypothetical protein [Woeseiaceae bacterium]
MNEAIRMQISAFVDGELPENEQELLLRRLSQDAVLRKQVAEYLAIGHAMRGEMQIGGANSVRERVARALDEKPLQDIHDDEVLPSRRIVRPLAGFAIAASVALIGVFGLQQMTKVDADPTIGADVVAETGEFPTQPAADDLLRQYELMHSALASDNGANNIRARLTSLELLQENAEETAAEPAAETAGAESDDSNAE